MNPLHHLHNYVVAHGVARQRMPSAFSGEERRKEDSQDVPDSNFWRKAAIRGSTLKLDCLEQPIAAKFVELAARTAPISRVMIGWAPRFEHDKWR